METNNRFHKKAATADPTTYLAQTHLHDNGINHLKDDDDDVNRSPASWMVYIIVEFFFSDQISKPTPIIQDPNNF